MSRINCTPIRFDMKVWENTSVVSFGILELVEMITWIETSEASTSMVNLSNVNYQTAPILCFHVKAIIKFA